MRAAEILVIVVKLGVEPVCGISDYSLNVLVVEAAAGLVTGLEVEYLTSSAVEGTAGTEDVTVYVPGGEDKLIGLRNAEGLSVHLLEKLKASRNSLCDGVLRKNIPDDLLLIVTPIEITRGAYYCFEGLTVVTGVNCHESHAMAVYSFSDLLNDVVSYLSVSHMTPPDKNVGAVKHIIGESVIRLVKGSGADLKIVAFGKNVLNAAVDTLRVYFGNCGL